MAGARPCITRGRLRMLYFNGRNPPLLSSFFFSLSLSFPFCFFHVLFFVLCFLCSFVFLFKIYFFSLFCSFYLSLLYMKYVSPFCSPPLLLFPLPFLLLLTLLPFLLLFLLFCCSLRPFIISLLYQLSHLLCGSLAAFSTLSFSPFYPFLLSFLLISSPLSPHFHPFCTSSSPSFYLPFSDSDFFIFFFPFIFFAVT